MIHVVSGALGSGKSWWSVRMMLDHLRAGGIVVTNLDLVFPAIENALYPRRVSRRQIIRVDATMSPFDLPRGDFRGSGSRRVVVVLDEALNWFASQGSKDDDRKATWGEWLRQSDKLGQDVYFIAQEFARAAKWIRELAQVSVHIVNFGQVSLWHIPIGKLLHLRRVCGMAKIDLTTKTVSSVRLYWISPRIWKCYDTAQLWGFNASANAYDAVVLPPAFPVPRRAYFVVVGLLGLGVVRALSF